MQTNHLKRFHLIWHTVGPKLIHTKRLRLTQTHLNWFYFRFSTYKARQLGKQLNFEALNKRQVLSIGAAVSTTTSTCWLVSWQRCSCCENKRQLLYSFALEVFGIILTVVRVTFVKNKEKSTFSMHSTTEKKLLY